MEKIHLRSHSDSKGILSLNIPVELKNTEFSIVIEAINPASRGGDEPPETEGSEWEEFGEVAQEGIYEDLDELL